MCKKVFSSANDISDFFYIFLNQKAVIFRFECVGGVAMCSDSGALVVTWKICCRLITGTEVIASYETAMTQTD